MTNLYIAIMILGGAAVAAQVAINAQFGAVAGSALWAANASFAVSMVAGVAAVGLALASGALTAPDPALWTAPRWIWLGGLGGALFVLLAAVLAHRLGAALLSAAGILGQLAASLLIDHYGWFGMPVNRVSATRVLGAGLLLAGVTLIRWR